MSRRKITCLITGNSYTFGKDYFDKKVKQPLYASDLPQVTLDIPFKDRSVTLGGQPAMEVPTATENLNDYNNSRINQLSEEDRNPYGNY